MIHYSETLNVERRGKEEDEFRNSCTSLVGDVSSFHRASHGLIKTRKRDNFKRRGRIKVKGRRWKAERERNEIVEITFALV